MGVWNKILPSKLLMEIPGDLDPQVNYVHPLWTFFDPGWTYLGPSKFDHIWDIGAFNHVKKSIFLVQT